MFRAFVTSWLLWAWLGAGQVSAQPAPPDPPVPSTTEAPEAPSVTSPPRPDENKSPVVTPPPSADENNAPAVHEPAAPEVSQPAASAPPVKAQATQVAPDDPTDGQTFKAVTAEVKKRGGSAAEVVRAILGLVALLALAYLGGHPRVQEIENRLRIAQVVTAGLPFVLLGLVAHLPRVGVLSDSVMAEIRPLLSLGLGWIGFTVGFRFDARLLDSLPRGTAATVALFTGLPFAVIVGVTSLFLFLATGSAAGGLFLRDALVLGTAGTMTAAGATLLLAARVDSEAVDHLRRIIQLEELAGVAGLLLLGAYFRPDDTQVAWHLPGTAWLLITLGMGAMIGVVVYALLWRVEAGPEFILLLLGAVCFSSGMASFLRLSPIVVCFIAGVILVNFPATWKDEVRDTLARLERPIYLLFLVVAGAQWQVGSWQGWVLMALYVAARFGGKYLGMVLFRRLRVGELDPEEQRCLVISPEGALSIAIIVNARDLYSGQGPAIPWIVTAVIGGAIVTEVILQTLTRNGRARVATPVPVTPSTAPTPTRSKNG